MTEYQFWKMIENARGVAKGDLGAQVEALTAMLAKVALEELIEFDRHVMWQRARAFTWDLWGAAYLINGGCSDDGFDYFRQWLILQGRANFENALADPDSLAAVAVEEAECEGLLSLAAELYLERTGQDIPPDGVRHAKEPTGENWEEDDLPRRFPRLAAKFT